MNATASPAASSISSNSGSSRHIDWFCLLQYPATPEIIATLFDGLPINQINWPAKRLFKRLLNVEEGRDIRLNVRLELDQKVGVAIPGVEVGTTCSRPEDFQPANSISPA